MEAVPAAGDKLERVINEDKLGEMGGLVAEDAMKDVHEDVQKARPTVYRAPTRLVPRHERHPWNHPESNCGRAAQCRHRTCP